LAFALIAVMIVVTLLFTVSYIMKNKNYPRAKTLIEKFIRKICWNMVIKTFQAGFLGNALSALITLSYSKSPSDLTISSFILTTLVTLVILNGIYLWKKPTKQLARKYVRSKLGATYSELNIYSRFALL
jgi:Ni,Fe-hydrogenase I cytochrome b subunit